MPVARLAVVGENEALACAGDRPRVRVAGEVTYASGRAGTVIIVTAGDGPARDGVWSADRFRLLGPVPRRVAARLRRTPGSLLSRPIHLFVRLAGEAAGAAGAGGCLYLGESSPVMLEYGPTGGLAGCELAIRPPLDRRTLERVRPRAQVPEPPSLDWLDGLGGDRTAALREFLTGWHPADPPPAAPPASGSPPGDSPADSPAVDHRPAIPAPLAELHRYAAAVPDVLGVQNRLLAGAELQADDDHDGLLVIGTENQGACRWLVDPAGADPTVWLVEPGSGRVAEREPLSGFLVQFCLFEAALGGPYTASAIDLPRGSLERLTRGMRKVPLRPWRWPADPTGFFVAPGLVACVSDTGDGFEVWVGARHRSFLGPLAELGDVWEHFDG